jgi:hypothetical protein
MGGWLQGGGSFLTLFVRNPEVVVLAVNSLAFVVNVYQRQLGASIYWLGCVVLTVGVIIMKQG